MKDTDIQIGRFYDIKFGNKISVVRIFRRSAAGGWDAYTVSGDKQISIRSASRIVRPYNPNIKHQ